MVPFVILTTTPYIQQFIVAGLDHVLFLDVNKTWLNYNTCLRRLLLLKKKKGYCLQRTHIPFFYKGKILELQVIYKFIT